MDPASNINVRDLLALIGDKEVQLSVLRGQLQQAAQRIEQLQAQITTFEQDRKQLVSADRPKDIGE